MCINHQTLARTVGGAVAAMLIALIVASPGAAQDNQTVITRSWLTGDQAKLAADTPAVRPAITRDVDGPDRQPLWNVWAHFTGLVDGGGGCGKGFSGDFGSVILLGMGGMGTHFSRDFSIGLPPLNQALARRLMEETEVYGMIQGCGLKPPADLRQLERIIVCFSNLIVDFHEIVEMDINPLAISDGKAFALSARVIIDKECPASASFYPHLVITPYPTRHMIPWTLSDGTEILLRPVKPEDEPLVKEMLSSLSAETLRGRFLQTVKSITHEMLIKLCNVDYDREMTMVAEIRGNGSKKIIGVTGLMVEPDLRSGEFGVIIHDHYQGKGIGNKLIDVLIGIAQEKELKELYGIVLADNRKMLRVCQKLGFAVRPFEEDLCKVTLSLH